MRIIKKIILNAFIVSLLGLFSSKGSLGESKSNLLLPREAALMQQYFFVAVEEGDRAVVEKIISDINVNEKNKQGLAALMIASYNGDLIMVKLLIKRGAVIDEKDENGNTALIHAAGKEGKAKVVKFLLENGSNVNTENIHKETPLIVAVENGRTEIVRLLLESGADADAKDVDGLTVLIHAVNDGFEEIVKLLMQWGVVINETDKNGWTALMYAAQMGFPQIVSLLLANGADFTLRNNQDEAALDIAKNKNHNEVVKVIEDFIERKREERREVVSKAIEEARPKVYPAIAQEIAEFEIGK
ncbi:MAG: ankyrin repeat domain-containing protein [Candidatus Babeliales bacterium]